MKKINDLGLIFGALAWAILVFWVPALLPGKALFLRDLCIEIIPYRSFLVRSGGFALWNPLGFFGMPYAANPQLGSFYPLNLVFFISPIWKGLIFYIILHYLLASVFTYLLFRELEFSRETSAFVSVAFCFGGFFSSLSNLAVLLAAAGWVSLSGWLLIRSLKSRWLINILFLSLVFALQFLAGDPQIFGESILISAFLAISRLLQVKGGRKAYGKLFAGLGLALALGLILSCPQIFLAREMFPFSNRASGYGFEKFALWSLQPGNLLTLFFPNYFLPPESRLWLTGFLHQPSYLLSLYPGILVLLLAGVSFRQDRRAAFLWGAVFLAGIFFALGKYNPATAFIFNAVPFLKFLRIPEKFYFWSAFSLAVLAGLGLEGLIKRPWNFKAWYPALLSFLISFGLLPVFYWLRKKGLGSDSMALAHQFLIQASAVKSLSILFAGLAWILLNGKLKDRRIFAIGIILLVYFDLASAHFRLNPVTDAGFFTERPEAVMIMDQNFPDRKQAGEVPVRMAVLSRESQALSQAGTAFEYFQLTRGWLIPFWGVYYQINDALSGGSYYLADIDYFYQLLKQSREPEQVLARCGVQLVNRYESLSAVPDPLDRAMIFYQAEVIPNRENLVRIWLSPEFPFREKILLESGPEPMPASSLFPAEPAEIVKYGNQKVEIKFNARAGGWLLLLDTCYPGWRAYLDGKETEIYRANRFFRAVPVPAGAHRLEFRYLPDSLIYGIIFGGIGLLAWAAMLIFSWQKWKS